MSSREDWDRDQVLHAVGWMARRNGSGSSIYARPARSVLAHPWILVDDLDIHAKTRITEHHPPAAFVETSAGHWQAWLRLDHPLETDPRARVARWLAETYSRNPDTAAASPFGRLPGITNQHPGRRQHDGLAPFTRLTDVHPEYAIGLDTLPASATPQITTPAREMRPDEPSRRTRARDQDFAIACRLVELGQHDPAIAAVLQAVRRRVGSMLNLRSPTPPTSSLTSGATPTRPPSPTTASSTSTPSRCASAGATTPTGTSSR